jgi:hypothetical protein
MIAETATVADFVNTHGITLKTTKIPFRPDGGWDGNTDRKARHFACELSRTGAAATVRFLYSQGSKVKGRPTAADALDCLKMDASSAGGSFEDWASDYGYDADSRKALATFEACQRIRRDLIAFLGPDGYRELENVESL